MLAALTAVLCYLALTRDTSVDGVSTSETLSAEGSPAPSFSDETSSATPSPPVDMGDVPKVPDQRRADFTKGDDLPDGARALDTGSNRFGIGLRDGLLVHGEPTSRDAMGLIETALDGNVASLGFRVRFADEDSGSAFLAAWESSAVDAAAADQALPASGFRLVVAPGSWRLTVLEGGEDVVAEGTYEVTPGPATFSILRRDAEVFVVDPTGTITAVTDVWAAQLAGSWASWGLLESDPAQTPAAIEAVWGG